MGSILRWKPIPFHFFPKAEKRAWEYFKAHFGPRNQMQNLQELTTTELKLNRDQKDPATVHSSPDNYFSIKWGQKKRI